MSRDPLLLVSLDQMDGLPGPAEGPVELGELLVAVSVMAANVVNDLRENLRNLVGGRMRHYEKLIEQAVEAALADLAQKARERGYDGVVGVKIAHPQVVDGGVEVIVYGNGFRYR
ncbi:YbjQ family protein [Litorilinea aerophila]|nr:heavy metal-binding domain-containing protein [Litorilinea aerophila]MCC9076893.1 YbjQ family protein [Litorilinea aerophila]GIV78468.1 MAG: hypothetical protein KatS3mg050_2862 [Litorilinea sp.]